MTDKQTLFSFRLAQAEETISEAKKMVKDKFSPRSIINRAYYSMFYVLLALFLKTGINLKTSKHSGVIAVFDKEFVHTGRIDRYYSKVLHKIFEARQKSDYKEFTEMSDDDASKFVKLASEFIDAIKKLCK